MNISISPFIKHQSIQGEITMSLKSKLKDNVLCFQLPLQEPKVSASGKTVVVATTRGQVNTGIDYKGSDIILIANAYVANNKRRKAKDEKSGHARQKHEKQP
jgi:hypothetical protein